MLGKDPMQEAREWMWAILTVGMWFLAANVFLG